MSTPIRPLSGTEFPAPAALTDERVDRLLPESEDRSRLEGAAETVGATLGRAVSTVRDLPRRFTVIRGGASNKASDLMEGASAKLGDLKHQARDRAEELGTEVRNRAEELGSEVRSRAEILGTRVRGGIHSARVQVRGYIHEYPLQCLGGVFGAAFLAGLTLRIWRTRD
jgi:ElaB/YqjD/DUF883 family membrane-anchored ribosome-binding protein